MYRETTTEASQAQAQPSTLAKLLRLGESSGPSSVLIALDDSDLAERLATELMAQGAAVCVLSLAARVQPLVESVSSDHHGHGYFDLVVTDRERAHGLVRWANRGHLELSIVGIRESAGEGEREIAVAESPRSLAVSRGHAIEVIVGLIARPYVDEQTAPLVH